MLTEIKNKVKGLTAKLILIVLTLGFVFIGFYGINNSGVSVVAEVGNKRILLNQFSRAYESSMRNQTDITPEQRPQTYTNVLNQMVNREVLFNMLDRNGFSPSDEQLAKEIYSNPAFQRDNRFDRRLLDDELRQNSISENDFEEDTSFQIAYRNFSRFTSDLGNTDKKLVEKIYEKLSTEYSFQYLKLTEDFVDVPETFSDEEIQNFYDENQSRYFVPEKFNLNLVLYNVDEIVNDVVAHPEEIKKYYDDNLDRFRLQEGYGFTRIVIPNTEKNARRTIDRVYRELKDAPQKFDELREKFSIDNLLGQSNGKLENFNYGVLPEYDLQVRKMNPGDVSIVFNTGEEFTILRLDAKNPARLQTLQEVEARIADVVKNEKAAKRLGPITDRALNNFRQNGQGNFTEYFEGIGKEIVQAADFSEDGNIEGIPNARGLYFGLKGKSQGAVEMFDGGSRVKAIYEVTQVVPRAQQPLEEVKEQVTADLRAELVDKALEELYNSLATEINNEEDFQNSVAELKADESVKDATFSLFNKQIAGLANSSGLASAVVNIESNGNLAGTFREGANFYLIKYIDKKIPDKETEEQKNLSKQFVDNTAQRITQLNLLNLQKILIEREKAQIKISTNDSLIAQISGAG